MNNQQVHPTENPENIQFASSIIDPIREPVLVVNSEAVVVAANDGLFTKFGILKKDLRGRKIFDLVGGAWDTPGLHDFFRQLKEDNSSLRDCALSLKAGDGREVKVLINASGLTMPGRGSSLYLISFEIRKNPGQREINYQKLLNEILSEAPAYLCTLRGPSHIFELANDKYLQLMGYRDILGKTVREALPEVENQGFFEILDRVYQTGEPYVGREVSLELQDKEGLKQVLLDFVYQPIKDAAGKVDGIFVHAIDVTEKVQNRKILEESEQELRNLIDSVPVMVWLGSAHGEAMYLNENWYRYTAQEPERSLGAGWMEMVHPQDREWVEKECAAMMAGEKEIHQTFRLKTANGDFRWVMNRGRPRYGSDGRLVGYVGSILDVHEEQLKEQLIREKEHRIRSMVEEATVATAVYLGKELTIEFANDAMLSLWGKDRTVIGKQLEHALPELEGQPFLDLLHNVLETGETYWGKEDRVDLLKNGKMVTGFFNFTYKPLRDQHGKIYGILNMALEVTDMVETRNLLTEREKHFRLMADMMPEKVINTDVHGEAIYFNQNWLDYTGLNSDVLKEINWTSLIHPGELQKFRDRWQHSLETGDSFEMELRIRDRDGKYLWHLSRAEAVSGEDGEITMWIGTNTEIQKLKEEEKRKEDFLKMVSHELKTPVTSIKGYVQLLLNILKSGEDKPTPPLPLKPSLERIDNQIGRLTRLISEMLDLSRLEENKLELKKEVFSINELVEQTVQDIKLTNTQHQIEIFHRSENLVKADKDRIGQVIINFITNAIKYSPESQHVEIHVYEPEEGKVAVSVRDRGIGISKKDQKHIFKRFYRIGGESEDTYSGFGIGLYLAEEIIQRHKGQIKVNSKKGKGSDFCFVLSTHSEENADR